MMWIRTPSGKRINLAALAYVEPKTGQRGEPVVIVGILAAGSISDGDTVDPALVERCYTGEDAATILKSIDMIAGVMGV